MRDRGIRLPEDCRNHHHRSEWWWFAGRMKSSDERWFSYTQSFMRRDQILVGFLRLQEHDAKGQCVSQARQTERVGHVDFAYEDSRHHPQLRLALPLSAAPTLESTGAMGSWRIRAPGVHLKLSRRHEYPVLHGDGGVVDYGDQHYLAFYSWMHLPTVGVLEIGGDRLEVQGSSWMDHQWGDVDTSRMCWRYLAVQLDGGPQVMAFEARHLDTRPERGARMCVVRGAAPETIPLKWHIDEVRTRLELPGGFLEIVPTPIDQVIDLTTIGVPTFYEGFSLVGGEIDGQRVGGWAITEIQPWRP